MIIKDVICPYCGSLCDDLEVVVEGNKIIEVRNGCKLSESRILTQERIQNPMLRQDGKLLSCSLEQAIQQAAKLLAQSSYPLLYGWSSTSCEAIRIGIELAEELGGIIDNTATICHGPSLLAVQSTGLPSCTLGQIKNRADLVIYWGSNQAVAHPRHMSRYSAFTKGYFEPEGRYQKKLVVIDVIKTETANVADLFIQVKPGSDYEILNCLRALLRGYQKIPDEIGGVKRTQLLELVQLMKSAKFGMLFFGLGLTQNQFRHKNVEAAIQLTAELNRFTKFCIMPMRGHFNVTGFNEVCSWLTGFPYAVDFSMGYPWYCPGETSAVDVLARAEVDAALIIASDPVSHFPWECIKQLARIPVIQIDPHWNPTSELAQVIIPVARVGIEAEGTAYRMDHVPIRLRKILETQLPSDKQVLSMLLDQVRSCKRA